MLNTLSSLITQAAHGDPKVIVLTGDHGATLFDELRSTKPDQFINVGVAEQAMIGIASGLAKEGFKPICYGLAAFVPMRCLEQIKLDVCYFNLPILIIGSGGGLIYSHLGPSHQCAEDIACLMPMPNMRIYSPCDKWELQVSWRDAMESKGPSYLRIGQAYHPEVHHGPLLNFGQYTTHYGLTTGTRILAHGSMVYPATEIAKRLGISCISIPRLKPLPDLTLIPGGRTTIVMEEHSKFGGLYSLLALSQWQTGSRSISGCDTYPICLNDKFSGKCGDYQYALAEHKMDDEALLRRVKAVMA